MEKLTDLPNFGPKLAEQLTNAGIKSPEMLRKTGADGRNENVVPCLIKKEGARYI